MNTIWQPDLKQFQSLCEHQPKYRALATLIEQSITQAALKFDDKLPPQRLLADKLKVTHGTVTRAYALLEQRGQVAARLGAGTFVAVKTQLNDLSKETDFASSVQPMMGQQQVLSSALKALSQEPAFLEDIMVYKLNGLDRHQRFFKHWLAKKGIEHEQSELIFSQGAQQGIYSVLATLCQSGDMILHEALSYPGFYKSCQSLKLQTQAIPIIEQGIDLNAVEQACKQGAVKAIYITPNCQNPTNTRYSDTTLTALLALSRRYNFFIIEDDVNYCLPEHWRLPLFMKAPDRVFYIASFSKYFSGGMRVGYLLTPILWQQQVLNQIHAQCWSVSMMNFELLMRAMQGHEYSHNQEKLAIEIRYRINTLNTLLNDHGFKAKFAGLNAYLPLPESVNMHYLAGQLKANKVVVRTLDAFLNPHSEELNTKVNGLRFTLGGPSSRTEFDLGIARVEQVLCDLSATQDVVI